MKISTQHTLRTIAAVLTYVLLLNQFAIAQQPTTEGQASAGTSAKASPEDDVKSRLLAAHTLYVYDDGADSSFPENHSYAHDRIVASLKSWGRFTIVSDSKDADIVMQVRGVMDMVADSENNGVYPANPHFKLIFADPATLKRLWSVNVPVLTGTRKKDKADRIDLSIQNVTSQLKLLTGTPLSTTEAANLKEPVTIRHRRNALLIGSVVAASAVGVGLVLYFKNKGEQDQRTFCMVHNIPNCPV